MIVTRRPGTRAGASRCRPPPDPKVGGHFVLAVGYDDEERLVEVENSWGPSFGKDGFGYLDYAFFGADQDTPIADPSVPAGEAWTLRHQADEPPPKPTPRAGRP